MKRAITFTLFLLNFCIVLAQNTKISTVSGTITGNKGEAFANAVIIFQANTDTLKRFPAFCDMDGFYCIELPKGEYNYAVFYMGRQFRDTKFRVDATQDDINLEPIVLDLEDIALNEAVVKANRPFVTYRGNNVVYNLAAHRGAAGSTLLDGLRFIPGIQTDGADGLSMFGFYKLSLAINGRILKLTNDEATGYLSTLSTADVEHVELIRNPGPEYGFQNGSVLNIVTKKKADEGVNAFLSASLTYQKMLSEQATGRVNINKGKWRNFVAYNFADKRQKETLLTSMGNDETKVNPLQNHLLQLGSEVQLAATHLVGMRIYGTKSDEKLKNTPQISVDMDNIGAGANLYQSIGRRSWTWNVNADYAYRNSKRAYQQGNVFSSNLKDIFNYLRASTDFLYRFTPAITLQTGGGWTKSDFDTRNSDITSEYVEKTTSAYLTLRYRDAQIDAHGGIQGNYDVWTYRGHTVPNDKAHHLWTWQPYFSIGYDMAQNHRVAVNFQTYHQRPDFRDLQPYTSSSAVFNRVGNPNLKNSTRYNLALSYTFMRAAMFEISLSSERNPIVESIAPESGNYYITKTNLDNSKYLRILAGAPVPIISKENGFSWLTTTYFAYHWQKDKGFVNDAPHKHHFHAYYVQHKQSVSLPQEWSFEAQITYYSPLTAGLYLTKKQWWIDFFISKRVGDWKFSLSGHDIFNTNVARGRIAGLESPIYFTKNWHSPKITLGVSLTLGNKKLKTSNRKNMDINSRLQQSADESISIKTD